jgi:hypothetical protein
MASWSELAAAAGSTSKIVAQGTSRAHRSHPSPREPRMIGEWMGCADTRTILKGDFPGLRIFA